MRHKYIVKNIFNEFSTFYLYVSTLQKFCLLLQFLAVHKILKGICTLNKIISKKWQNLLTKKCTKVRPLYFVNWYMVLIEISQKFALITFLFIFWKTDLFQGIFTQWIFEESLINWGFHVHIYYAYFRINFVHCIAEKKETFA